MIKHHVVKKGSFIVTVAHSWVIPGESRRFKCFENAYRFLRYRCNFIGWNWGTLYYHPNEDAYPVLLAFVDRED